MNKPAIEPEHELIAGAAVRSMPWLSPDCVKAEASSGHEASQRNGGCDDNSQAGNKNSLCADDVRDNMPLFRSGNGGSTPTSALQLQVRRVDVHRAIQLNELWHSRLPKVDWSNVVRASPYACYVAEYDDIAYAAAIWSAPCARLLNGRGWLELRRLAIAENAPKNTASRMLRVMRLMLGREFPQISRLISYQDTEVHTGTIYKAAGWEATVRNECGDWQRPNRRRNAAQSMAAKLRWEIEAAVAASPRLCGEVSGPSRSTTAQGDNK